MNSRHFSDELRSHREAFEALEQIETSVQRAIHVLASTLNRSGKLLICGNGGSAADAQHFAAELTGRFEKERRPLAAIALTTDTSAITAIGNDYGFDQIFSRQVRALGRPGDALIAISTSGSSPNVLEAARAARAQGLSCVGLTGRNGGHLRDWCEPALIVPHARTARIQEAHLFLIHVLCGGIEQALVEEASE